jgi:hypothetical protein
VGALIASDDLEPDDLEPDYLDELNAKWDATGEP